MAPAGGSIGPRRLAGCYIDCMARPYLGRPSRTAVLSILALVTLGIAQAVGGCEESADTGHPVMFQRGRLTWGLSTRPVTYGQKILVVLWIYNPSDTPLSVQSCGDIDYFWRYEMRIVDSAGNLVLSRAEQKELEERLRSPRSFLERPFRCWLNETIPVPPHACIHGSFSKPDSNFTGDLNQLYVLPPGRYSLVSVKYEGRERIKRRDTGRNIELPITVLNP